MFGKGGGTTEYAEYTEERNLRCAWVADRSSSNQLVLKESRGTTKYAEEGINYNGGTWSAGHLISGIARWRNFDGYAFISNIGSEGMRVDVLFPEESFKLRGACFEV